MTPVRDPVLRVDGRRVTTLADQSPWLATAVVGKGVADQSDPLSLEAAAPAWRADRSKPPPRPQRASRACLQPSCAPLLAAPERRQAVRRRSVKPPRASESSIAAIVTATSATWRRRATRPR